MTEPIESQVLHCINDVENAHELMRSDHVGDEHADGGNSQNHVHYLQEERLLLGDWVVVGSGYVDLLHI